MIKEAALKTKGSSGPSGLNANGWRKILVSRNYGTINAALRRTCANVIEKICTEKFPVDTVKDEHHLKRFWLADSFPLTKIQDYDQSEYARFCNKLQE